MAHRVAPRAEADLDDIWFYVAKESGSIEIATVWSAFDKWIADFDDLEPAPPPTVQLGAALGSRLLAGPERRSRVEPPPHASTVKKSAPARTAIWAAMKSFHVVFWPRLGAGAIPWRLRTLPTDGAETS